MRNNLLIASSFSLSLSFLGLAGCDQPMTGLPNAQEDGGTSGGDMTPPPPDMFTDFDSQIPPVLSAAGIEAWIQTGKYKQWKCEPTPVDRSSGHGTNRICSNEFLSKSTMGPYPVYSASVKELYDRNGTTRIGHAFSMRVIAGPGGTSRYWYERYNTAVTGDGQGATTCTSCHSDPDQKPKHEDYVFIIVR